MLNKEECRLKINLGLPVEYHILNLGAGVQSTTLYLLNMMGTIMPKFDLAIFADTQEEPKAVYEHLKWLQSLGGPEIWVRTAGSLGANLMIGENSTKQRFVSIPAYTAVEGAKKATGLIRRQCTSEYKILVIDRAVRYDLLGLSKRKWWPKNATVHHYFGISVDEARRSKNIIKNHENFKNKRVPHFPLLELNWTRGDCQNFLKEHVPHPVPRSACVFCPYKSNYEWLLTKQDPEAWARAVQIDRALRTPGNVLNRNMNQKMYLHNSAKPLEEINFEELIITDKSVPGFAKECTGGCGL
jgi:hypothetical protein